MFQSCFRLIIIFIRMLSNMLMKKCFSQSDSSDVGISRSRTYTLVRRKTNLFYFTVISYVRAA